MVFTATSIGGAFLVDIDPHEDHRGFFARTYCAREFAARGLEPQLVQGSISWSRKCGTVRGMHFQKPPSQEAKLVRCVRGRLFDVILDLRPESPTFTRHFSTELVPQDHRALYIPPGVAHGFQTLEDDTEVCYWMSDYFAPELATGVRWNDPAFGIRWPLDEVTIAGRDSSYPNFDLRTFLRPGD